MELADCITLFFKFNKTQKPVNADGKRQKKLFGHHYYGTPQSGWVNLNGRPRPPSYP